MEIKIMDVVEIAIVDALIAVETLEIVRIKMGTMKIQVSTMINNTKAMLQWS